MCRVTGYLGPEIRLNHLLSDPDNALIRQFSPQLHALLNLAGFGMIAWDDSDEEPLVYRSTTVPIYDTNLDSLCRKLPASTVLAHVRGIPYRPSTGYGPQNLHPFNFPCTQIALAHNGDLARFPDMRLPLLSRIRPEIAAHIQGTTDSEYIYAVFLSHLRDPGAGLSEDEIVEALNGTVRTLVDVRQEVGIDTHSSLNLILCAKDLLVCARLTLDFGLYPLDRLETDEIYAPYLGMWFTAGDRFRQDDGNWFMHGGDTDAQAILVSSEPLTRDTTGWVEVPEYGVIVARRGRDGQVTVNTHELVW